MNCLFLQEEDIPLPEFPATVICRAALAHGDWLPPVTALAMEKLVAGGLNK